MDIKPNLCLYTSSTANPTDSSTVPIKDQISKMESLGVNEPLVLCGLEDVLILERFVITVNELYIEICCIQFYVLCLYHCYNEIPTFTPTIK